MPHPHTIVPSTAILVSLGHSDGLGYVYIYNNAAFKSNLTTTTQFENSGHYISSTETYKSDYSSSAIPSLTLLPPGDERSRISLHFPGSVFRITPNGLTWTRGKDRWTQLLLCLLLLTKLLLSRRLHILIPRPHPEWVGSGDETTTQRLR